MLSVERRLEVGEKQSCIIYHSFNIESLDISQCVSELVTLLPFVKVNGNCLHAFVFLSAYFQYAVT